MRAFNQSNNSSTSSNYHHQRSKSSCSYCGDVDHQVTSCPHVKSDWAMFQSFTIPCSDPDNWTNNPKAKAAGQRWNSQSNNARWFKDPTGWSKWHAQCEKAYEKILKAEARAKVKTGSTTKRVKSCGFCGGIGHNRRDCPEMTALNKRLIRANNHWRQRLYDYFVEELGLGVGALIKIDQSHRWQQPDSEHVAIVTSINWDELNMFCYTDNNGSNWNTRVHQNLQSPLSIKVQVDGKQRCVSWRSRGSSRYGVVNDVHGRPLIDNYETDWNSVKFKSVISPTETPLSEDWLTQGQAECVQFITKKYSFDKLKEWKGIKILEDYEKRYNLK
jgi:hypothetical protein